MTNFQNIPTIPLYVIYSLPAYMGSHVHRGMHILSIFWCLETLIFSVFCFLAKNMNSVKIMKIWIIIIMSMSILSMIKYGKHEYGRLLPNSTTNLLWQLSINGDIEAIFFSRYIPFEGEICLTSCPCWCHPPSETGCF